VEVDAAMRSPVFTPNALEPARLDALTFGRADVFDDLMSRLRSAARDGSRPHTLLIAAHGGGKTHTLHVAVNRALADEDTRARVLPVLLPESSLAIGSYLDLLTEIAGQIGGDLPDTARALRRTRDPVGIEAAISAAAGDRMILLGMENLDRVFDRIGETGQGSLRAWVETSTAVLVFGTAPALFPGVSSRTHPWYGSFIVETLPELDAGECVELFTSAAEQRGKADVAEFASSNTGRQRLSTIHRLIGGSPRLWHLLADVADVAAVDEVTPVVHALLDQMAPYYQQRLWELPAGEQRLVVELARGRQARTVGDLADAVGVSNQSAASALGRLSDGRWVSSSKAPDGDRRTSWYDVTDPLLRYWVQYREGNPEPLARAIERLRDE
jgi:DNA-binding MarR family transcriptional regulator